MNRINLRDISQFIVFRRFNTRAILDDEKCMPHVWSLIRTGLLIWLMSAVSSEDVKTEASKIEKTWLLSTLGMILAFFIYVWAI
jgi:hypothetical protein